MIDEFSNYMLDDELIVRIPRLDMDIHIRSITTKKVYSILKECRILSNNQEIDELQLRTKFIVSCTVSPDFMNAALQDKYGVKTPEDLVQTMFKPGEFNKLSIACMKICGYDTNPEEDIKNLKN